MFELCIIYIYIYKYIYMCNGFHICNRSETTIHLISYLFVSSSVVLSYRRERNRMHAKMTRDRKKTFIASLKRVISKLEEENRQLRETLEECQLTNEEVPNNASYGVSVTGPGYMYSSPLPRRSIKQQNSTPSTTSKLPMSNQPFYTIG